MLRGNINDAPNQPLSTIGGFGDDHLDGMHPPAVVTQVRRFYRSICARALRSDVSGIRIRP